MPLCVFGPLYISSTPDLLSIWPLKIRKQDSQAQQAPESDFSSNRFVWEKSDIFVWVKIWGLIWLCCYVRWIICKKSEICEEGSFFKKGSWYCIPTTSHYIIQLIWVKESTVQRNNKSQAKHPHILFQLEGDGKRKLRYEKESFVGSSL